MGKLKWKVNSGKGEKLNVHRKLVNRKNHSVVSAKSLQEGVLNLTLIYECETQVHKVRTGQK